MARRALKFITMVSTVLLVATVLLFLAGYIINPWDHYVSLSVNSHVGLWNRGLDSRIVFFNDPKCGPYRGSIIGFTDAQGNVYPPPERAEAIGDAWGIYYRYFDWSGSKLWTLMVTLWYPIIAFAIMPGTHLLHYTLHRSAASPAQQKNAPELPMARNLK